MAMSDTCFEALWDLSRGITHYNYLKYDSADLSLVVDSMYNLARFGILQDNIERPSEDWIVQASNRIVIGYLIEFIEADDEDAACECIASIAKHNVMLADGIKYLANDVQQKSNLFDAIAEPVMHERLEKITAYCSMQCVG
jgi:hypothetical protein